MQALWGVGSLFKGTESIYEFLYDKPAYWLGTRSPNLRVGGLGAAGPNHNIVGVGRSPIVDFGPDELWT